MALVLKDRVQETSTTTGTGTLTLAGAVTQFQTFSAAVGNGNTTYYTIYNAGGTEWEVGLGTVGAGTLARTTVLASSNAGAAVNFTGTLYVFGDYPADKAVFKDASGNVTGYAISGGTINNTVIGGTTPVAGTFTDLTANDNVILGSSNADTLAVNGRITTDLEPNANNSKDIGTNGRNWRDAFFGRTLHTVNLELTGTTSFDGAQGTSGQVLTSAGTGATPTWTTPTTGTVTSVDLTASTGISVSGGPITGSGSITVTNTAPDQTVVLTAGTGISTSGTYPSFTITNSGVTVYPGAGIANSTGTAWGTSYTTSGSGTVVALTTAPALNTPVVTNYTETLFAPAAASSFTVDLANGTVQKLSLNANGTITLPSSVSGKSFVIIVTYSGAFTLTWAGGSTIKWPGGTVPTASSANGKFDIFTFFQDGTNTYGNSFGLNY